MTENATALHHLLCQAPELRPRLFLRPGPRPILHFFSRLQTPAVELCCALTLHRRKRVRVAQAPDALRRLARYHQNCILRRKSMRRAGPLPKACADGRVLGANSRERLLVRSLLSYSSALHRYLQAPEKSNQTARVADQLRHVAEHGSSLFERVLQVCTRALGPAARP